MATSVDTSFSGFVGRPDVRARIYASNWQRRGWTLQEGVLARELWFQFQNLAVSQDSIEEDLSDPWKELFDDPVGFEALNPPSTWEIQCGGESFALRVFVVWQIFGQRGISRAEDIPLCTAILMDMDIGAINSVVPAERQRKFWTKATELPGCVLFAAGERYDEPALRWALRKPIDCVGKYMSWDDSVADLNTSGELSLTAPGFLVPWNPHFQRQTAVAIRICGVTFLVRQRTVNGNASWMDSPVSDATTQVGVILRKTGSEAVQQNVNVACKYLEQESAALVSIVRRDPDAMVVHYVASVVVIKKGGEYDRLEDPWISEGLLEDLKHVVPVDAAYIAPELWRIVPPPTKAGVETGPE